MYYSTYMVVYIYIHTYIVVSAGQRGQRRSAGTRTNHGILPYTVRVPTQGGAGRTGRDTSTG